MSVSVIERRRVLVGEPPPLKERAEEISFLTDVDDVLVHCWSNHVDRLNQYFGTDLTYDEVACYGYAQNVPRWLEHEEELFEFMRILRKDPDFIRSHQPIEGALEGLLALTRIISFRGYVTTRPESALRVTREQLFSYGFPSAPVICMPDELLLTQREGPWKRRQIEGLGVDLVIEDNVGLADGLPATTKVIIIEGMHNRICVPQREDIVVVPHWSKVVPVAESLKERASLSRRQNSPFSKN